MQQGTINKIDKCIEFINEDTANKSPWILAIRSSKLRRLGISSGNEEYAISLLLRYRLLMLRDECEEGLISFSWMRSNISGILHNKEIKSKKTLKAYYEYYEEHKAYHYKKNPQPDEATELLPIDPGDFERLISNDALLARYGSDIGNRLLRLDLTSRIAYTRYMANWTIGELADEYDVSENNIVWSIMMCNLAIRK